jgi:hypothetical protein
MRYHKVEVQARLICNARRVGVKYADWQTWYGSWELVVTISSRFAVNA